MVERGENLRFALKTCHALSVAGEGFGQDLDSYVTAKLGIVCTVNLAHPTRTNRSGDFIRAEVGPSC